MRTPQKKPLNSIFDVDPKKYHDNFSLNNNKLDIATLLQYRKPDFVLKILRTRPIDPSTPVSTKKNPTKKASRALSQSYDQYNLLAMDKNSHILYMTTRSEFEYNSVAKTQICLPLKLLFAALN